MTVIGFLNSMNDGNLGNVLNEKWTVQRKKTVRSEEMNPDGLKGYSRRSKWMKLDSLKG